MLSVSSFCLSDVYLCACEVFICEMLTCVKVRCVLVCGELFTCEMFTFVNAYLCVLHIFSD